MTREQLIDKLKDIQNDTTCFGECGESELNKAHFYALDLMDALPDIIAALQNELPANEWQILKTTVA